MNYISGAWGLGFTAFELPDLSESASGLPPPRTMSQPIQGKTAIVTGAGSGINLAFAEKLLDGGCNVLFADLALRPEAQKVVDEYTSSGTAEKGRAVFQHTDVTDWKHLERMFEKADAEFGEIDIVCPGAGVYEPVCTKLAASHGELRWHLTLRVLDRALAVFGILREHLKAAILLTEVGTRSSISTSFTRYAPRSWQSLGFSSPSLSPRPLSSSQAQTPKIHAFLHLYTMLPNMPPAV